MKRKKRKEIYIRIKNSWKGHTDKPLVIPVGYQHNYLLRPGYPINEIHMDFRDREAIAKYGVIRIG